jgi:hypothetical protein
VFATQEEEVIKFSKEQEHEIVATLKVLHKEMTAFALIGAIGHITKENVDALKMALIVPLAVLETTDEEYHGHYEKAREIIEQTRANRAA